MAKNNSAPKGRKVKTKQGAKPKKRISRKRRRIRRIAMSIFVLILIAIAVVGIRYAVVFQKYQKEAAKKVKEGGINAFKQNQTSIIYDSNGNVISELSGSHDSYYIESDKIPQAFKDAFVDTEDRNFHKHSGVDLKAIMRAFYELVRNNGKITQGGSTITQQLARNVFLSHEVSMERKLKEMFIAREIEKRYSKKQILEFYLNNINFGNGFYGIEAAARGYFSKSVGDLTLAEIAYISSIPNNPTLYDPFVHDENTQKRKNRILDQMYKFDDISKSEYDEAKNTTVVLNPEVTSNSNSYVQTYAAYCATQALMAESGFEFKYYFDSDAEEEAYDKQYQELYNQFSSDLYTGGYKIYTSIDMRKQEELQTTVDTKLSGTSEDNNIPKYYDNLNDDGIFKFQGSATCIDNETGKVVAIVGGRTQQLSGQSLNRAYQSYRQPGSTIKPILVYTPAFENGYVPRSLVVDSEIKKGPVNSPNVYDGSITIRYAVEKSKNTTAWKLFEELGFSSCIAYLKNMNFHRIVPDDYNASMSIGGMTYGVSTLEMASAYATLANDGEFRSPTCILKIKDVNGSTIINNEDPESKKNTVKTKKVYETNSSRMMTDVLTGVLVSGTGKKYQVDNAICAAKTGTTNENKDVWLCGYSRYYTTAVWVGYDMPLEIDDGVGNTLAGYVWQSFMEEIHEGLEKKSFEDFEIVDGKNEAPSDREETTTAEGETTTGEGETTTGKDAKETTTKKSDSKETTKAPAETTKQEETTEEIPVETTEEFTEPQEETTEKPEDITPEPESPMTAPEDTQ